MDGAHVAIYILFFCVPLPKLLNSALKFSRHILQHVPCRDLYYTAGGAHRFSRGLRLGGPQVIPYFETPRGGFDDAFHWRPLSHLDVPTWSLPTSSRSVLTVDWAVKQLLGSAPRLSLFLGWPILLLPSFPCEQGWTTAL